MTSIVGLTGGIATGKSTVSHMLADQGLPIVDADAVAHRIQQRDHPCYQALVAAFGATVAGSTAIDRRALGAIVFDDPAALHRLNRVMDPFLRQAILGALAKAQGELVVLDAPLLFEAGYASYCDYTVCVTCPPELQIERLQARNGIGRERAVALINKQWPLPIKEQLADWLINNASAISNTHQQVLKLLDKIR